MKLSSELFQNLPYFWSKKTPEVFSQVISFHATLDGHETIAIVYTARPEKFILPVLA